VPKQILTWGSDSRCLGEIGKLQSPLPPVWSVVSVNCINISISNGSKLPGRFTVRFHPNPDRGNGSYHTKTRTVGDGAVLPPKTWHLKLTILAPIKYLSSDRITTWSVRTLCSCSRSFSSRFQICDPTTICWVAIEIPLISLKIGHYFTTTQRISVGSQIWKWEVKERLKLHNLHTDHVVIQSGLKYLIGAKGVGTVYLKPRSGSNPAKHPQFYVQSG